MNLTDDEVIAIMMRADEPGTSYTRVQATLHALCEDLLTARTDAASLFALDWSELNAECQARVQEYARTKRARLYAAAILGDDDDPQ